MNIQWYPGHMTKAKRMMQENIKLIDLVIELVDARVPISSRNQKSGSAISVEKDIRQLRLIPVKAVGLSLFRE